MAFVKGQKPPRKGEKAAQPDYVCIEKCFFNSCLWRVGDETGHIPGIEKHSDPDKPDCWFEQI